MCVCMIGWMWRNYALWWELFTWLDNYSHISQRIELRGCATAVFPCFLGMCNVVHAAVVDNMQHDEPGS